MTIGEQIDAVHAAQIAIRHNREHAALTRVLSSGRYTLAQARFAQLRMREIERELRRRLNEPLQAATNAESIK